MRISDWSSDVCSSDLDALALDPQAYRIAQAGRQAREPCVQACGWLSQIRQRPRQRGCGLLIAIQLQRAGQVDNDNKRRHGQCQRVRRYVARTDPTRCGKADGKYGKMKKSIHKVLGWQSCNRKSVV